MAKILPNSFQVVNLFVDSIMADLSGSAVKCYLVIVRKTVGWHKEHDDVSVSQFMKYTGLSNRVVIKACGELTKANLISQTVGFRNTKKFKLNLSLTNDERSQDEKSLVTKGHRSSDEKSLVTSDEKSHTKDISFKDTKEKQIYVQFEEFWSLYPKKINKTKARKIFEKIDLKYKEVKSIKAGKVMSEIMYGLQKAMQQEYWQDSQHPKFAFVPHPTTWLNGKRWADEIYIHQTQSNHSGFGQQNYKQGSRF